MSLRDRCKEVYQSMCRNAMMRQGSPVDDLEAFVNSELGMAEAKREGFTIDRETFHHLMRDGARLPPDSPPTTVLIAGQDFARRLTEATAGQRAGALVRIIIE